MAARRDVLNLVLCVLVTAGLAVDAYVHFKLAPEYQLAQPGGVGQGTLFRVEAVAAVLVAALVLIRGDRWAFLAAAAIGFGGFVAVVLYRYVDVPGFGPVPSMYEPIWYFEKSLSAVAEALVGVVAVVGAARASRRPRD